MNASHAAIRTNLGRALRRMRHRGHLSLDEIEHCTRLEGVPISRSHLSRVETGQADIALSRFLSLMVVIGCPVAHASEELLPLVSGAEESQPRAIRSFSQLRRMNPGVAASQLRKTAFSGVKMHPSLLAIWGLTESALGRWKVAGRALTRCLPLTPSARSSACLAVACLGQNLGGLSRLLVTAIERERLELGTLLRGACLLSGGGNPELAARALSGLGLSRMLTGDGRGLALGLAAEAYRRSRQVKAAVSTAENAVAEVEARIVKADLLRIHARCLGTLRRPAAGLRLLDRARALAKGPKQPDLLASIHLEKEKLWILAGDRGAARSARRAAAALLRRSGADRNAPRALPLHGLLEAVAPPIIQ